MAIKFSLFGGFWICGVYLGGALFCVSLFVSCVPSGARAQSYGHDPALDAIGNGLAIMDADINKGFAAGNSPLTEGQYTNDTPMLWSNYQNNAMSKQLPASGAADTNSLWSTNNIQSAQALAPLIQSKIAAFATPLTSSASNLLVGAVINGTGLSSNVLGGALSDSTYPILPERVDFNLPASVGTWSLDLNILTADPTGFLQMFLPVFRELFLGFVGVILIFWALTDVQKELDLFFQQQQVRGLQEEAWGTNVSLPTSFAYSWIFIAVLGTAVTAVLSWGIWTTLAATAYYFFNGGADFSDLLLYQINGVQVVQVLLQDVLDLIPAITTMKLVLGYVIFRVVGLKLAFYVARIIVRVLPV